MTSFKAVVGYSVTGAVSYTGSATGPVELFLQPQCTYGGAVWGVGTEISAKGTYTIHGVPPGTYSIKGWIDTVRDNWPNASDPTGISSQFTVYNADTTSADLTLADPTSVAFNSNTPSMRPIPSIKALFCLPA